MFACFVATASSANQATDQASTLQKRISGRSFPSVFQAWNRADNLPHEDPLDTEARHDLLFHVPDFFGLRWNGEYPGLATGFTPKSIAKARERRQALLKRNPNMVLLAEIRYHDAPRSHLPDGHTWWKRTADGKLENGWEEGGYIQLAIDKSELRDQVARQAAAVVGTGVVDGVMLDWWDDDAIRLDLIRRVRKAIGDKALIVVNTNDRRTPKTAPYVNGYFMEAYRSETPEDWAHIASTLRWAEVNLRAPRVNCLETWFHTSRQDLALMRATTTLALTHSDGYCLFSDPNPLPTPDHLHNWYSFWNKVLGRPTGPGSKRADGSYRRAYEKGVVVYNPPGNPRVKVVFTAPHLSRATGLVAKEHWVSPWDGDIFIERVR